MKINYFAMLNTEDIVLMLIYSISLESAVGLGEKKLRIQYSLAQTNRFSLPKTLEMCDLINLSTCSLKI